jgi:hypothetical protein
MPRFNRTQQDRRSLPIVGPAFPGVDSLFFVDVRSGRREFSGRTRCAQRQ